MKIHGICFTVRWDRFYVFSLPTVPLFIPFSIYFQKMDLYIHFVSSARMGQNVYIIPILLSPAATRRRVAWPHPETVAVAVERPRRRRVRRLDAARRVLQRLLKRRPRGAGLEHKSAPPPPRVRNYTAGTELDAFVHDGWRRQGASRGRRFPMGPRERDPEVASTSSRFRTGNRSARRAAPRQDSALVGFHGVVRDGAAARRAKVAPGEATVGSR